MLEKSMKSPCFQRKVLKFEKGRKVNEKSTFLKEKSLNLKKLEKSLKNTLFQRKFLKFEKVRKLNEKSTFFKEKSLKKKKEKSMKNPRFSKKNP